MIASVSYRCTIYSLCSGLSLGRLHMRGICPPIWGGTNVGDKALIGGTHKGGHRPYVGGPNFDRLYHKLKVLLLLSCNYTMQFVSYNSIKTRRFVCYRFQIRTITQHQYKRIRAMNCIM